jgi:hypothetical protein
MTTKRALICAALGIAFFGYMRLWMAAEMAITNTRDEMAMIRLDLLKQHAR